MRTCPNDGVIGEDGAVVGPFAGIAIDRPAFAELRNGETLEELSGGATEVGVLTDMGVRHDYFCFLEMKRNTKEASER